MNPAWQGKLDATLPFVPLNQCEPLPWDDPLMRLAYWQARRRASETRACLRKSRRGMWRFSA